VCAEKWDSFDGQSRSKEFLFRIVDDTGFSFVTIENVYINVTIYI
jgi:hypothetical protein